MSAFEFVFALVSVITSLALTQIIGNGVALLRSSTRGRVGLVHALWIYFAFTLVIGNWAGLWFLRERADWSPFLVATIILAMVTLYAFAALVLPAADDRAPLSGFHEREGRRYIIAHLVFTVIAIAWAFVEWAVTGGRLAVQAPALIALVLGSMALVFRARWVQLAIAIALCVLVTIFTAGALHIAD